MATDQVIFVDDTFTLQRMQQKGGWTFVLIPLEKPAIRAPFGMQKVNGFIDSYELKEVTMWSMKNQGHFLAIKASIRKAIGKEEGDTVRLTLYTNEPPPVDDDDFLICLKDDPDAYAAFLSYPEKKKKLIRAWVLAPLSEDGKIQRIAEAIDRIAAGFDRW